MLASTVSAITDIYTVSQLNLAVKNVLEGQFTSIYVEGEISNFTSPHSGHWYFSLKDQQSQVRCAMFRAKQRVVDFTPKDGGCVLVKACISLYTTRGDYQLLVETMEERGEGRLRRAYEALWKKLAGAGLFDIARKRHLPAFPRCLGVVTSASGAVIRDILTIVKRRFPAIPVIIYPTLVQGTQATSMIITAIQIAAERQECDIIILARGGGSLEDLWCFNDEALAYAIYHSPIPIISGIGHEVDFSIADFAADIRAPTPSAAAEIAVPEQTDLLRRLQEYQKQLLQQVQYTIGMYQQRLARSEQYLERQHPKHQLQEKMQQLDLAMLKLTQLAQQYHQQDHQRLTTLTHSLQQRAPVNKLQQLQHTLAQWYMRLQHAIQQICYQQSTTLTHLTTKLTAFNPAATLQRGYAIVSRADHTILRETASVKIGDHLTIRLASGELNCRVEQLTTTN